MAVEYITSKNLFYLICDTLSMMNAPLVEHGRRVSYIMAKMLECKGGYEKFEIADFMLLAVMHDIGAYKTDDVRKQLTFEAKNTMPHSIYGYLFLKYLSPLTEQSKMLLYHHVDTNRMKNVNYQYIEETEILKVAEIMDIWQKAFAENFNYHMIDRYIGTKFSKAACDLLYQAVEKFDIFRKLDDGSFMQEYEADLEYVLLSDEEKDKYLKMLMYCTGLRSENMVADTIATICVSRELATMLRVSELDKKDIYYAAMLQDIGMLAIPEDILDVPRKLKDEEMNLVRTHVDKMAEALQGKISKNVIDIARAHHERFDGTGYPRGLRANTMNMKQAILQVSENVVQMAQKKAYREAFTKDEIINYLTESIVTGHFEGVVTDTLLKHYDVIMDKANEKAKSVLVTHEKLKQQYEQVYNKFMN